jgi:transposase-like protein
MKFLLLLKSRKDVDYLIEVSMFFPASRKLIKTCLSHNTHTYTHTHTHTHTLSQAMTIAGKTPEINFI